MDSSSIRLPGSELAGISFVDGTLRIDFARAYIIKTMTGSAEKTLWWQAGALILDNAELLAPLPQSGSEPESESGSDPASEPDSGPESEPVLICDGGDIDENVYTYRDMIPIPLESRGQCRCDLKLRGRDARISAQGETIRLEMQAVPKYIEHIRPG